MSRKWLTGLVLVALALCLGAPSCFPISPTPTGSGGAPSAQGGAATGGDFATGGAVAAGGATPIVLPTCPAQMPRTLRAERKLNGWRPDAQWNVRLDSHARKLATRELLPEASAWWRTNLDWPLDQDGVGACVGFGSAGIASSQPFPWRWSNAEGFRAYTVATRIDQGCDPLGTGACPGAYPNADPGSYSSSGMQAGMLLEWWRGWTAVPSVAALIQRLQRGPCGIGKTWHNDEFDPSTSPGTCGRLSQTGGIAGGHFMAVVGFSADMTPRRIYVANSWDKWGACLGSYCAYAYLDEPDLAQLLKTDDAELVCPDT